MKKIILFDGECALCSSSVQFILKRNDRERLYFASLQSNFGRDLCLKYGVDTSDFNSLVFIDDEGAWRRSTAALRIARYLKIPWRLSAVFRIVPVFIRDALYDIIARNRYRWFGRHEQCFVPRPEWRERFLG